MVDDPVKAKGLLGVAFAEANGLAWQLDTENFGLGLGATEDAKRWVEIGREVELRMSIPKPPRRGPGQPRKTSLQTNDVKRAFLIYCTLEKLRKSRGYGRRAKIEAPLRTLIEIARYAFPTHGLFDKPKAHNKMLASVKRGRERLGIDDYWRGPTIEELLEHGRD